MLNRIVLGLNLVTLFVVVGERSNVNAGSLSWLGSLPWSSFATETWALTTEPTVSSEAILAVWLFITGLWVLTTVSAWMLGKKGLGSTHCRSLPALGQAQPVQTAQPRLSNGLTLPLRGGLLTTVQTHQAQRLPRQKATSPQTTFQTPPLGRYLTTSHGRSTPLPPRHGPNSQR